MADGTIFIGGAGEGETRDEAMRLLLKRANRHGLVAGATGTGKTVTLQVLAEGFSAAGVPVFLADVKGDLTGLCEPGDPQGKLHGAFEERAGRIGLTDFGYDACPAVFWDVFGDRGHPVRTTITEMGPVLLSRMLGLNDTQEGVLTICFRVAEEEGLALLDLADLRAMLLEVSERRKELGARYGNVSAASVGAIQRRLLTLEDQGGDAFFGEPALALGDIIATTPGGRGRVNVLVADRLIGAPRLYACVLLWLLSELFEALPEVGDPDRPVLAFFFDEAHLLFDDAPPALLAMVERMARLIRSKGVSVWFVTQSPADVPDDVLGQLGNKVQHALRAWTPRERRALKAAADSFRPNPAFDAAEALPNLGVGEALVSCLDAKGVPLPVGRTLVRPPSSRLGPASEAGLARARAASPVAGVYDAEVDRESAFELLAARAAEKAAQDAQADAAEVEALRRRTASPRTATSRAGAAAPPSTPRSTRQSPLEAAATSALRAAGTQIGRSIVRSLMRSLFR